MAAKRPETDHKRWDKSLVDLMVRCWDQDPSARPTARQIYAKLLPVEELERLALEASEVRGVTNGVPKSPERSNVIDRGFDSGSDLSKRTSGGGAVAAAVIKSATIGLLLNLQVQRRFLKKEEEMSDGLSCVSDMMLLLPISSLFRL